MSIPKSKIKIRFSDCDPLGHLNNVKYLEYFLNAREDHVEEIYGFSYEEYTRQTGCTWVTVKNEIAYLKEVKYNEVVEITSKMIESGDILSKVELIMTNEKNQINAVMWITVLYFNLENRKAEKIPEGTRLLLEEFLVPVAEKTFDERINNLRKSKES